jgi:hypothetical protein
MKESNLCPLLGSKHSLQIKQNARDLFAENSSLYRTLYLKWDIGSIVSYTLRRDCSVGTATDYSLDGWFRFRQGQQYFLFSKTSRLALGPTQPPIQWVPGVIYPRVKQQRREAGHSPPSSTEVKNGGVILPPPSICLHGIMLNCFIN